MCVWGNICAIMRLSGLKAVISAIILFYAFIGRGDLCECGDGKYVAFFNETFFHRALSVVVIFIPPLDMEKLFSY